MSIFDFWTVNGFEISSFRWGIDERKNKSHSTSGSDNTGQCTYTYNELGFRGDSIYKNGFKIMSIGDSNTEGVGVDDIGTWPRLFSNLISNSVNLNFGTGGRSNDFISRCLLTYYDYLKPDLVLIMYSYPQRREIYTKNCGIEPFVPTLSWGFTNETHEGKTTQEYMTLLQNENEDLVNWYKNHLLIKFFLEIKKCNWLWNGWAGIPSEFNDSNRFDGDYDKFFDHGVDGSHPGPKHNQNYSISLYNYINNNFKNFIP